MAFQRALINNQILIWARKAIGYAQEEAANKIGVSLKVLQEWESNEKNPTMSQLRKIGYQYKRPSAFFYLDDIPEIEQPDIPDMRKLPSSSMGITPALRAEIWRVNQKRENAIEISNLLGETPPLVGLDISANTSYIEAAQQLRKKLNISINDQFGWKNEYVALNTWIEAIEMIGILVIQSYKVDLEEMRGFSISKSPYPIIVINGKDSPRGRIFSLIHELTHVALHKSGICDMSINENSHKDIEVFCNYVAGEVLVPKTYVLNHEIVIAHEGEEWDEAQLKSLSKFFSVSKEVILRKLLIHNLTSKTFYEKKRTQYLKYYIKSKKESPGFAHHHKLVLNSNGKRYTNMILTARNENLISSRDLSNFMGSVKLKHINRIREEIF